ncbi:MAG: hypothetical protein IJB57_01570 [Clostridia bacterium]|nr:hypothetical protein [Clostridia bacterium]
MKKKISEFIAFILALAVVIGTAYYIPYVLMPVRKDYGATWNMYLEEPEDSIDVILLGSSLLYCDVVPACIYDKTGITSYVVGGGSLSSSIGYYYLRQALKTQSPDLVMIEATNVYFKKYEEYTKVNIGYMPYGMNRLGATLNAAEPEERFGLLFPLYNYHDLWEKHTIADYFSPRADEKTDINAGYTYLTDIKEQNERTVRPIADGEMVDFNYRYLEKTVELCREKGIKVELFLSPSCYYLDDEAQNRLKNTFPDVTFVDYSDSMEEMGIDMKSDFYDKLHLNFSGADKFSGFLAEHITEYYDITEREHSEPLWQERVENYNKYLTGE